METTCGTAIGFDAVGVDPDGTIATLVRGGVLDLTDDSPLVAPGATVRVGTPVLERVGVNVVGTADGIDVRVGVLVALGTVGVRVGV